VSIALAPSSGGDYAIFATGLRKSFGATEALRGVDLAVERGSIFGLLGPNGAGKTTLVRILTTLLKPDAGSARVGDHDVVHEAEQVRCRIGLAGQYATVDELLTGRANLEMIGRLYHLPKKVARQRAEELLERFALTEAAGRIAKTYSGGMRRRLDLAASLVVAPPVLFLDEPTTGLDPASRQSVWDMIGELVADGTTVLLTTQYLDEADRLADEIAVIDHGMVIAEGSPDELKASTGGEQIDVVIRDGTRLTEAAAAVGRAADAEPRIDRETYRITAPVPDGAAALIRVVREFDAAEIAVDDIALRRPTLDEVFLNLTGHATGEADNVAALRPAGKVAA
jgi:ABC-2 type transport system ATP-binding protein